MKKFLKNLVNTVDNMTRKFCADITIERSTVRAKLDNNNGAFVMDHAAVFVLILVLAGIALVLLTNFLQDDMAPTLRDKIMKFFN